MQMTRLCAFSCSSLCSWPCSCIFLFTPLDGSVISVVVMSADNWVFSVRKACCFRRKSSLNLSIESCWFLPCSCNSCNWLNSVDNCFSQWLICSLFCCCIWLFSCSDVCNKSNSSSWPNTIVSWWLIDCSISTFCNESDCSFWFDKTCWLIFSDCQFCAKLLCSLVMPCKRFVCISSCAVKFAWTPFSSLPCFSSCVRSSVNWLKRCWCSSLSSDRYSLIAGWSVEPHNGQDSSGWSFALCSLSAIMVCCWASKVSTSFFCCWVAL